MKKEKKSELIKAAVPAIMMLSGMWNAAASIGGDAKPTAADVAAFRNQQTQQEQPAETAFMQGEDSEGEAYLARANGCQAECMASCEGACEWTCDAACKDDCYYTCTGGCKEKCSGSCKGGCQGVCRDNCYGGCRGSEARNSENKQDMEWIDSIRRH